MVVFMINTLFIQKKFFLQISSSVIKNCNTFLEAPSIINENLINVACHSTGPWTKLKFEENEG